MQKMCIIHIFQLFPKYWLVELIIKINRGNLGGGPCWAGEGILIIVSYGFCHDLQCSCTVASTVFDSFAAFLPPIVYSSCKLNKILFFAISCSSYELICLQLQMYKLLFIADIPVSICFFMATGKSFNTGGLLNFNLKQPLYQKTVLTNN